MGFDSTDLGLPSGCRAQVLLSEHQDLMGVVDKFHLNRCGYAMSPSNLVHNHSCFFFPSMYVIRRPYSDGTRVGPSNGSLP